MHTHLILSSYYLHERPISHTCFHEGSGQVTHLIHLEVIVTTQPWLVVSIICWIKQYFIDYFTNNCMYDYVKVLVVGSAVMYIQSKWLQLLKIHFHLLLIAEFTVLLVLFFMELNTS